MNYLLCVTRYLCLCLLIVDNITLLGSDVRTNSAVTLWADATQDILEPIKQYCTKLDFKKLAIADLKNIHNKLYVCFAKNTPLSKHFQKHTLDLSESFTDVKEAPEVITAHITPNSGVICNAYNAINHVHTSTATTSLDEAENISLVGHNNPPCIAVQTRYKTTFYKPENKNLRKIFSNLSKNSSLIGVYSAYYWLCNGDTCSFHHVPREQISKNNTVVPRSVTFKPPRIVGLEPQTNNVNRNVFWAIQNNQLARYAASKENGVVRLDFVDEYGPKPSDKYSPKPHTAAQFDHFNIKQLIPCDSTEGIALAQNEKKEQVVILISLSKKYINNYRIDPLVTPHNRIISLALYKDEDGEYTLYALTEDKEKNRIIESAEFSLLKTDGLQKVKPSLPETTAVSTTAHSSVKPSLPVEQPDSLAGLQAISVTPAPVIPGSVGITLPARARLKVFKDKFFERWPGSRDRRMQSTTANSVPVASSTVPSAPQPAPKRSWTSAFTYYATNPFSLVSDIFSGIKKWVTDTWRSMRAWGV